MSARLRKVGVLLAVLGLVFVVGGVFAATQVKAGQDALQAFSEKQNVTLSYNEDGQLVDRGQTEGADRILSILEDDWGYPVKSWEFDPNDPLVNTGTEYMYQMATIAHHTIDGTVTVTLTEDAEYNGEVFPAGTYEFNVDGKYWTDFDRLHPIEGKARSLAWSDTVHGLFGELGVGAVTASTLQLGWGISALIVGIGGTFFLSGAGLWWAASAPATSAAAKKEEPKAKAKK